MIYSCVDVGTEEPVEVNLPMSEAPQIGSEFEHEGRRLRRVPESEFQSRVTYDEVFWNFQIDRRSKEAREAPFHCRNGVPGWKGRDAARDWGKAQKDKGLDVEFDG